MVNSHEILKNNYHSYNMFFEMRKYLGCDIRKQSDQGQFSMHKLFLTNLLLLCRPSDLWWARSLSHDFKISPITFQGSGPILISCEKTSNIHITASLRTSQNRKYM